jgi:hypothetical protein
MRQVGANQDKFKVINFTDMITYYSPGALCIHNKIQLQFLMAMQGKIKIGFYAGEDGKTITAGQRDDFPHYIFLHMAFLKS